MVVSGRAQPLPGRTAQEAPAALVRIESSRDGDEDEPSPVEMLPDTSPLPQDVVEQHDTQRALRQAIQTLSPKMRQVVILRYEGKLSFAEIGQTLTIPEATARTYFMRSKHLLRATLAAQRQAASG